MTKTIEVKTAYDFLRTPYLQDKNLRELAGQQPQTYVQWLAEQIETNGINWAKDRYEQARAFKEGC